MSDTESIDDLDRIAQLKDQCLREASNVTGLKGKKLVVVLRRSSENEGEYYCALRGQSDGKYLKLWMNKDKTYPSHIEALEAQSLEPAPGKVAVPERYSAVHKMWYVEDP
ncbi:hypothetical protein E8E12_002831 [Didymella heteroderae]|uniref:Uncharacterized protein n=1 Tax=Didymella heteroderae TaxID=1769908 RepID=A0A9P4WP98_9PLEO|nr:hypothetical protein E8E12_002831 [Didymella heteroderae]